MELQANKDTAVIHKLEVINHINNQAIKKITVYQHPPQKGINGFKSFEEVKKSKAEYPAGSGNFTTLEEIWNKALAGDLEASGWWRDTSKLNNSDGVAVKAYTEYFNLAKRNKQTA